MSNSFEPAKAAAKAVLDLLPDDASWEDVQYHLYVRSRLMPALRTKQTDALSIPMR